MKVLLARSTRARLLVPGVAAALSAVAIGCVPEPPPPTPDPDPVVLWSGHVDGPGVGFEDGEWDLHVHDHGADQEYEPDEVVLGVAAEAETVVPSDPAFSFLGDAGDAVWILPESHVEGLLSLGYAAEEIEDGVIEGDELTLSLLSVEGPGSFAMYDTDGLGEPDVVFDSDDALPQALAVAAGAHVHVNWAFSAPGTYTVTYEVTGSPVGGSPSSSGPVEYTFEVAS
jgi:surface-anchored protein